MDREETLAFGASGIDAATGLDELREIVFDLRDRFGAAHLGYHTTRPPGSENPENIVLGTADPAWCGRYIEQGYIEIDPVIKETKRTGLPVDWDMLDRSSVALKRYFKELDRFEVGRRGYSIPCFSPDGELGIISFSANHSSDEEWVRFYTRKAPDLAFLGQRLHVKALSLSRAGSAAVQLTPQGKRLLSLLAQGHPPKAIAHMTKLSIHTVRMHLDNAQARLGCRTKTEAVRKAVDLGLIAARFRLIAAASATPLSAAWLFGNSFAALAI